ncbi:DUF1929 domain-containing protein [Streptomyces sp. ISL-66]|uniref:galactose oxidase early set domain-containing protein n=1 Tax=Streptomyces sp. ISL-66 TaxID=2819186 RepID=UPI001BE80C3F|nr:galactose oxidase early set domain-containing protein [Streptomyces sp. ISL-66]MBT2470199.1 DUF1929 domain-containing protein [Streptomyces sp. ISL-66]
MPWNPVLIDSEILAVHAAFLNFDRIIYFAGSQYDAQKPTGIENTRLYNCGTGEVSKVVGGPGFDLFCCGHALSANGTLLAAGGTAAYEQASGPHATHWPGTRGAAVVRYKPPSAAKWVNIAPLNRGIQDPHSESEETGGRWYPTLLTLGNGDILALSGHPGDGDLEHNNFIPEVFQPFPWPDGEWHRLGSYSNAAQRQLFDNHRTTFYPRAHLLPTGDVVFTTMTELNRRTVSMTVKDNPWSATFHDVCQFTPVNGPDYNNVGFRETSVLLPLLAGEQYQRRRVLIAGGKDAWILDLSDWEPGKTPPDALQWERTERALSGHPRRMSGNAVLLPTGEVLFVGGVKGTIEGLEKDSTGVQTPEVFDPHTNKWTALTAPKERAKVVRNYHSVALLMRDGRVWTAGSCHDGASGLINAEMRIEIYEPWYYGNPNRPEILAAPDRFTTGDQFVLRTTQATEIRGVAMVRAGSCTHAFNADQRYVSMAFHHEGSNILIVTAPPNGNIAPAGIYFLYTINDQGLPSEGITIYHNTDPASDTEGSWDALFQT